MGWTQCLFKTTDIRFATPTLRCLEMDYWAAEPSGVPELPLSTAPLVSLRLCSDGTDDVLLELLHKAGSTLVNADIYTEHVLPAKRISSALLACAPVIERLRFISNPPNDVLVSRLAESEMTFFDTVLPHFVKLKSLSVSATDISCLAFSHLPPCLRHLSIQSFNHYPNFELTDELLEELADPKIKFNLKDLTVLDSTEFWDTESRDVMTKACAARGISFTFVSDEGASEDL